MIEQKQHTKLSKFLSLVLRHKPEEIGISLDSNGWVGVQELISKMCSYGKPIDFETLEAVVATNNKKRFAFNDDRTMIRANQGHSIEVNLGYQPKTPPPILYHGTASRFVDDIFKHGLKKMERHHVHLSKEKETAKMVGQRHGKPVVFEVLAGNMVEDGIVFYESDNGVWLTDEVSAKYLVLSDDEA